MTAFTLASRTRRAYRSGVNPPVGAPKPPVGVGLVGPESWLPGVAVRVGVTGGACVRTGVAVSLGSNGAVVWLGVVDGRAVSVADVSVWDPMATKLVVGAATGAGSLLVPLALRAGVVEGLAPPGAMGANPVPLPGATTGLPPGVCVGTGTGVAVGSAVGAAAITGASVGVALSGGAAGDGALLTDGAASLCTMRGLMSSMVATTWDSWDSTFALTCGRWVSGTWAATARAASTRRNASLAERSASAFRPVSRSDLASSARLDACAA